MNDFKHITRIEDEHTAILTLNRPPANALGAELLAELAQSVETINRNNAIKAVVLAGGKKFFSAGADIKELSTLPGAAEAREYSERGQGVFNGIESAPKPWIAAVEGVCVGGGLELALACHMRIAGTEARFALPEINLGLMPGFGGTARLPELIGRSRALEMMLTGKEVTAQDAQVLGLINQAVKSGAALETALHLARQVAGQGGRALAAIMNVVNDPACVSIEEKLRKEADAFGNLFATRDAREGLLAFLEKRLPEFEDR